MTILSTISESLIHKQEVMIWVLLGGGAILLSIAAFFVKRHITDQDKKNEDNENRQTERDKQYHDFIDKIQKYVDRVVEMSMEETAALKLLCRNLENSTTKLDATITGLSRYMDKQSEIHDKRMGDVESINKEHAKRLNDNTERIAKIEGILKLDVRGKLNGKA